MLLTLATAFLTPGVVELVSPSAGYVTVQAIVSLPREMGPRDHASVRLLAEALIGDTTHYTKHRIREVCAGGGGFFEVRVMPDHMRVMLTAAPDEANTAIDMLNEVCRMSTLTESDVNTRASELPFKKAGPWRQTLNPVSFDFQGIRYRDLRELYDRLFRPENITVAVGGEVTPGEAAGKWASKQALWELGRLRQPMWDKGPQKLLPAVDGTAAVLEVKGAEFSGRTPDLSTRILALIALGSGKGSSLFRTVREQHAWSYQQVGALWPTPTGFQPRLIVLQTGTEPSIDKVSAIRDELRKDVQAWTDRDLARASGMAEAILLHGALYSPLYLSGSQPLTNSLEDRTFLAAYWEMKTGTPWNPPALLESMRATRLGDLKEAATKMLDDSTLFYMNANGR